MLQKVIFEEEFDRDLANCIIQNAKGFSRHCIRSAIRHLEKAWEIREIDSEMSVFRAITAEEEAATAIFIVLKERGYENAGKLKHKSHLHKQALEPFIRSIGVFSEKWIKLPGFPFGEKYRLQIEGKGKEEKLSLSFHYKGKMVTAIPPLGFNISINGRDYHFEKELLEITSGQNKDDVISHTKKIANTRNELLYAQTNGVPAITSDIEGHLKKRRNVVFMFMRIYGLIYPYSEKALFVQQAINAFLKMMGEIEDALEE